MRKAKERLIVATIYLAIWAVGESLIHTPMYPVGLGISFIAISGLGAVAIDWMKGGQSA